MTVKCIESLVGDSTKTIIMAKTLCGATTETVAAIEQVRSKFARLGQTHCLFCQIRKGLAYARAWHPDMRQQPTKAKRKQSGASRKA